MRLRPRRSHAFLRDLLAHDKDAVRSYLLQRNVGTPDQLLSRTLVLIDATGSMGGVLQATKGCVREMMRRVGVILKDHQLSEQAFELQLAVYRNYGCRTDELLECSSWESSPVNLQHFLDKQGPRGGEGREAVEIALWHANEEHARQPLTQVVLIGDASPNTKEEVAAKRERVQAPDAGFLRSVLSFRPQGEAYWATTRFKQPTYWEDEAKKLAAARVPVLAFWLAHARWARSDFSALARLTGGSSQPRHFDVVGTGRANRSGVVPRDRASMADQMLQMQSVGCLPRFLASQSDWWLCETPLDPTDVKVHAKAWS